MYVCKERDDILLLLQAQQVFNLEGRAEIMMRYEHELIEAKQAHREPALQ